MEQYRFHLEKYHTGCKKLCPQCGCKACFTRYVDSKREIKFPDYVGRCDHEQSCGYHFTPRGYFQENPEILNAMMKEKHDTNISCTSTRTTTVIHRLCHYGADVVTL